MSSCTKEMKFFPSNFMLETRGLNEDDLHQPHTSVNPDIIPPQDFHGKRSMSVSGGAHHQHEVNYDQETNVNGYGVINSGDHIEDMYDDEYGLSQTCREKKRRLNMEQVKTLEKNFELGNKLEPDRKLQLARSLGLQPRQIAIWFQNRKARWKTKQLEKDYELLRVHFDAAKAENDSLQSQNQKLHAQILALKNREPTEFMNSNKETEGSCSNRSDENSSDINLDISRRAPPAIDSHPNNTSSRSTLLFRSTNSDTKQAYHMVHRPFENSNSNINISSASRPDFQSVKLDHHHHPYQTVKEESLSNMLCRIDDQTGFWPWLEHHHFS